MKYHKPSFFNDFHCIGSACSDTCCAGWEIEVDETTAEGYLQEPGAFGDRLRRELEVTDEECCFKLKENRCPFLNEQNLCDIFIQIGEDRLCDICREHPRFYNWFGDYTEVGLGLCCEEAQRLLFAQEQPLSFVTEETPKPDQQETDEAEWECEQMLQEREQIFTLLQDRSRPISARLLKVLSLAGQISEETVDTEEAARRLIRLFAGMESLDEVWPSRMADLTEHLPEVLSGAGAAAEVLGARIREYEHLAVYFVYRYYPECLFDGLAAEKLCFAVSAVELLYLLDVRRYQCTGSYTLQDRMELSRRFSKEIEYCPENLQAFETYCRTRGAAYVGELEAIAQEIPF